MNPPTPQAEILITRENRSTFIIHTASADARAAVVTKARPYGQLFETTTGVIILYVSPLYDIDAVARYLELEY